MRDADDKAAARLCGDYACGRRSSWSVGLGCARVPAGSARAEELAGWAWLAWEEARWTWPREKRPGGPSGDDGRLGRLGPREMEQGRAGIKDLAQELTEILNNSFLFRK